MEAFSRLRCDGFGFPQGCDPLGGVGGGLGASRGDVEEGVRHRRRRRGAGTRRAAGLRLPRVLHSVPKVPRLLPRPARGRAHRGDHGERRRGARGR